MGIKHYQEKNTRAMEKDLAQSDIPVKRKIQKAIRKYHISGKTTNTQPQWATCVSSSCYVGQTAMWQQFRSAGYARCCDNQKFYDRTHSLRWMSKGSVQLIRNIRRHVLTCGMWGFEARQTKRIETDSHFCRPSCDIKWCGNCSGWPKGPKDPKGLLTNHRLYQIPNTF